MVLSQTDKIFQVEEDATLIICTIDEKISQAVVFQQHYIFLAATSNKSSTQRIESSLETGICIRSVSIIRQSSAGAAGTVNLACKPDMLDFSA